MANTAPLKYKRAFTIRVDDEFLDGLEELRRLITPIPTKSDAVRSCVLAELARRRKFAGK